MIADAQDNRLRMVAERARPFYGQAMTAGDIHTIAGIGQTGFSGLTPAYGGRGSSA